MSVHTKSSRFLASAPRSVFAGVCIIASIVMGTALFFLLGIFATAARTPDWFMAMLAVVGFIAGSVFPVLLLRRLRRKAQLVLTSNVGDDIADRDAPRESNEPAEPKANNSGSNFAAGSISGDSVVIRQKEGNSDDDRGPKSQEEEIWTDQSERIFIPSKLRWRKRFDLIEKMNQGGGASSVPGRKVVSPRDRMLMFSFWGFLFGPFYYLWLGMWRKALVIFAAAIILALLVSQFYDFDSEIVNRIYNIIWPFYCSRAVIRDYYRKVRFGDISWWPWPLGPANGRSSPSSGDKAIDQLARIAALHADGAVTDDEYKGLRAKILGLDLKK